jgi:single-strand selective monofunctional uracil DNA glycosylase
MSVTRQDRDTAADQLLAAAKRLRLALRKIDFSSVAAWVYNPLEYAWAAYSEYVQRYARPGIESVFMGMNPGPWGMAQTGIPFGEVAAVRDYLQLSCLVEKPRREHPKRPVSGLQCSRSEVSGRRLWGFFATHFPNPDDFFARHFVINFCPLAFMDEQARNLTPDKFPSLVREPLEACCDRHLAEVVRILSPKHFIGVGGFAEQCGRRCIDQGLIDPSMRVMRILHPSPASPAANRDWAGQVLRTLQAERVW